MTHRDELATADMDTYRKVNTAYTAADAINISAGYQYDAEAVVRIDQDLVDRWNSARWAAQEELQRLARRYT